jgi:hypothetical protein
MPFPSDAARRAFYAKMGTQSDGRPDTVPLGRSVEELSLVLRSRLKDDLVHPSDRIKVAEVATTFLAERSLRELRKDTLPLAELQEKLVAPERGSTRAMALACHLVLAAQQHDRRLVLNQVRQQVQAAGYADTYEREGVEQTLRHLSVEIALGAAMDDAFESQSLDFPAHYTREQEMAVYAGSTRVYQAAMQAYWGDL